MNRCQIFSKSLFLNMLPWKMHVNKLVTQEGMTLIYHWTCSA